MCSHPTIISLARTWTAPLVRMAGLRVRRHWTRSWGLTGGGKGGVVAAAAGGFYGAETPQALAEHVRSYLAAVFAVIGITPQFIVAEGVQHGAEHRQTALNNAYSAIRALQPA